MDDEPGERNPAKAADGDAAIRRMHDDAAHVPPAWPRTGHSATARDAACAGSATAAGGATGRRAASRRRMHDDAARSSVARGSARPRWSSAASGAAGSRGLNHDAARASVAGTRQAARSRRQRDDSTHVSAARSRARRAARRSLCTGRASAAVAMLLGQA